MCGFDELAESGRLASRYAVAVCWAPATPTFAYEPARLSPEVIERELVRTKGPYRHAQYAGEPLSGANLQLVLARTLRLQGFMLYQHAPQLGRISERLFEWFRSGQLRAHEDLAFGLGAAPGALMRLFQGLNVGKQLVVLEGANDLDPKLTAS